MRQILPAGRDGGFWHVAAPPFSQAFRSGFGVAGAPLVEGKVDFEFMRAS
jgi:hypothetical protein